VFVSVCVCTVFRKKITDVCPCKVLVKQHLSYTIYVWLAGCHGDNYVLFVIAMVITCKI
jgi:hypothetical protein